MIIVVCRWSGEGVLVVRGELHVVRGGCAGGQGRVYWWSGEGVLVVRGGCTGGQGVLVVREGEGRVYWWSGEGVLVVRGGCAGGWGRVCW